MQSMESLASYATLLMENSNLSSEETHKQRKLSSRKKIDPLQNAQDIYARFVLRGNVFPCRWVDRQNDPLKEQEFKDALKLTRWKLALKGNRAGYGVCSDEVRDYLDTYMVGWRDDVMKRSASLKHAQDISRRYVMRGNVLPRPLLVKNCTDAIRLQEHKDYQRLLLWHKSLNGSGRKCPMYIYQYLDNEIPCWKAVSDMKKKVNSNTTSNTNGEMRNTDKLRCSVVKVSPSLSPKDCVVTRSCLYPLSKRPMQPVTTIAPAVLCNPEVATRANADTLSDADVEDNKGVIHSGTDCLKASTVITTTASASTIQNQTPPNPTLLSTTPSPTPTAHSYANQISIPVHVRPPTTESTTNITLGHKRSSQTLDEPSKKKLKTKLVPIAYAREIVGRYQQRGNVFPCRWVNHQNDPMKEQEFKDALKLTRWKLALKGNRAGYGVCSDEVRDYLDGAMVGWRADRAAAAAAAAMNVTPGDVPTPLFSKPEVAEARIETCAL